MVILIGGEKGGTGKTTIATNLAALRALAAHDILLVDRSQLLLERALVSAQWRLVPTPLASARSACAPTIQ